MKRIHIEKTDIKSEINRLYIFVIYITGRKMAAVDKVKP